MSFWRNSPLRGRDIVLCGQTHSCWDPEALLGFERYKAEPFS